MNKLYHLIKKDRYEVSDFALDDLQRDVEESLYHYGIQKTIEDAFESVMHKDIADKKKAVSYIAEIAARIKNNVE